MSAAVGYLAFIDRLATVRPPVFVFGGYAEDALLAGRTTRPHDDIDVLVGRVDLAEHLERFAEWGFGTFEVAFEVVAGEPLVYRATSGGIDVEVATYDELVPGRPSFVLPANERLTRVTLPSDSFAQPLSRIDGVSIRTLSPLALYQMRAAIMRTGVFGPPRPKDEATQAMLRSSLLAGLSVDELEPAFGPYPP